MYLLLALESRSVQSIVMKSCPKASSSQLRAVLQSRDTFVCHAGRYNWHVVSSQGVVEFTVMKDSPSWEPAIQGTLWDTAMQGSFRGRAYLGFRGYSYPCLQTWMDGGEQT